MIVPFVKLPHAEDLDAPRYETVGSAGLDLRAALRGIEHLEVRDTSQGVINMMNVSVGGSEIPFLRHPASASRHRDGPCRQGHSANHGDLELRPRGGQHPRNHRQRLSGGDQAPPGKPWAGSCGDQARDAPGPACDLLGRSGLPFR